MNTPQICTFITLTDPEVVAALVEIPEGDSRDEYIVSCVKVGMLALRAARGIVDGDTIRHASDHLIEQLGGYRALLEQNLTTTLSHYFDPSDGLFQTRIESLTKPDGELSNLMRKQVVDVQRQFDELARILAPGESNQMLSAMRDVMRASGADIASQFSLDVPDSALSRLVRDLTASHGALTGELGERMNAVIGEFSLDRPDSALSRLVNRVEDAQRSITTQFSLDDPNSALSRLKFELNNQIKTLGESQQSFQTEVTSILSAVSAKREADAAGTAHGLAFEDAVGSALRRIGAPMGDIIEDCGTTTGLIRNSKVGDFTITLPSENIAAGARIVVEAKESGSYTLTNTLAEADEARRNRNAEVCLFVHSARTWGNNELLTRHGADVIIVWDADDKRTNVILRAGYLVAKALSVRRAIKTGDEVACFGKIDKAVEVVRKQIGGFAEIITSSETIANGATKILNRARIMHGELEKQIEVLADEITLLRGDGI